MVYDLLRTKSQCPLDGTSSTQYHSPRHPFASSLLAKSSVCSLKTVPCPVSSSWALVVWRADSGSSSVSFFKHEAFSFFGGWGSGRSKTFGFHACVVCLNTGWFLAAHLLLQTHTHTDGFLTRSACTRHASSINNHRLGFGGNRKEMSDVTCICGAKSLERLT